MKTPTVRTSAHVKETHTLTLNREELLSLLAKAGQPIPASAAVLIQVPGGGDWSNTALDVDDDNPVVIRWVSERTENG